MRRKPGESEAYLRALSELPAWVVELSSRLSEEEARWQPGNDDWSVRQVFAHLEACAELWQRGIRQMIEHNDPAFNSPHPRSVQFSPHFFNVPFREAALRFERERREFLALFEGCDDSVFDRAAAINGRRQTVFEQLRRLAKHEERHRPQIETLVGSLREVT